MKKLLRILRHELNSESSYWQDFEYELASESDTVATALHSTPVRFEHSCMQKRCGACAMVIDGSPALACSVNLVDIKSDVVKIEPLRKFPVIEDLIVDRSIMNDRLKDLEVWYDTAANVRDEETSFEASRCLQCGLCLEVCPNFSFEGEFGGMAVMTPQVRLMDGVQDSQKKRLKANYKKSVYNGCGKSLACRDICPAKIDMEHLLVKGNRATLWNR